MIVGVCQGTTQMTVALEARCLLIVLRLKPNPFFIQLAGWNLHSHAERGILTCPMDRL